ncbi:MAG: shikimate dehydrogenase family protein [Desulfovibrionaceae bacterium]
MTYSFGIIGYPLFSTLSPSLHSLFYEYYGIDAHYSAFALQEKELAPFLHTMRNSTIKGLSVTLPYKEYILPLLDSLSPIAHAAGAVNTVIENNGTLMGDNTDIFGILAALSSYTDTTKTALILGTGGAARAAVIALKQKKIQSIVISGRTLEKACSFAKDFSISYIENIHIHSLKNVALIINTTPLGSIGYESVSPMSSSILTILKKNHTAALSYNPIFFDMNYTLPTTITEEESLFANWLYISGLSMFLAQAQKQFDIWKKYILL